MSVNPVDVQSLAKTYTTFEAAKKALQDGKINQEAYNALIVFKNGSSDEAAFYGLEVEQAAVPDGASRPVEERQKNEGALKAQFDAIDAELKAAGYDVEKLNAAIAKLDAFKKANPDFKPEQQPKNSGETMKFQKVRTINTQFYDIDIYENGRAIYSPAVPKEQQEVKSKKEIRKQIKADARYDDPNNLIDSSLKDENGYVKGTKNLESARASVKKQREDASEQLGKLNKEYNAARRKYYKLRKSGASEEEIKAAEAKYKALGGQLGEKVKAVQDASEAYVETNRALKTARGNGTRSLSRKERAIVKSENEVAARSHVYFDKAEEKAAVKENEALKGHVGHLDKMGADVLVDLQMLAMRRLEDAGIKLNENGTAVAENQKLSEAQLQIVQKWGDIVQIQLPDPSDPPEVVEAKTRATQKGLKAIAGIGNSLDPTEKNTLIKELKTVNPDRYKGAKPVGFRTELNKLFQTYGLTNENRLKNKGKDTLRGLAGNAGPALSAGALAYFKKLSVTAKAIAAATAVATATATASATATANAHIDEINIDKVVEDFATAVAHAEASVPGFSISYIDPDTMEEILKRVAGQYDEQTVEAVAHAIAEIHYHQDAIDVTESVTSTASSTVTATSTSKSEEIAQKIKNHDWKAALKATGVVLGVGAALDFLTSKGRERGVGSDAEEFKDAQFINMHKGVSAKAEAQNIIQLKRELIKKGCPPAEANQYIVDIYRQSDGVQNGVMTLKELTGVRMALQDVVDKYTPAPVPTEPPTVPPTVAPTEAPTEAPTACPVSTWHEWYDESTHCHPIKLKVVNGVSPVYPAAVRYGYNGPDGKPVTDTKILNKIQAELKRLKGDRAGIQSMPGHGSTISVPLKLIIDGKEYTFDCDNAKLRIENSPNGIPRSGGKDIIYFKVKDSYFKQDCNDHAPVEITKEEFDALKAKE